MFCRGSSSTKKKKKKHDFTFTERGIDNKLGITETVPPAGNNTTHLRHSCFFRYNLKIGFCAAGTVSACNCGWCSFTCGTAKNRRGLLTKKKKNAPQVKTAILKHCRIQAKNSIEKDCLEQIKMIWGHWWCSDKELICKIYKNWPWNHCQGL